MDSLTHYESSLPLTWGIQALAWLASSWVSAITQMRFLTVSEIPVHTGTAGCLISKFRANPFAKQRQGAARLPWQIKGLIPALTTWLVKYMGAILFSRLYLPWGTILFTLSPFLTCFHLSNQAPSPFFSTDSIQFPHTGGEMVEIYWQKKKIVSVILFSVSNYNLLVKRLLGFLQWTISFLQKSPLCQPAVLTRVKQGH
jgi:hypothetical protein